MDELLQEFISETRENLELLEGELVAWETDPADRERLDAIFRFFHTIKGSCGFLNLPRFERLSHAAEDKLSELREGNIEPSSALVSAILAIVDRIGELSAVMLSGDPLPDGEDEELLALLHDAVANPAKVADDEAGDDAKVRATEDASAASARTKPLNVRSVRIPLMLIDHMMNGVSDLVLARNEVSRRLREPGDEASLMSAFDRLSSCIAELRESVSMTRMQRIDRLFAPLPRLVREVRNELGKQVKLVCEGGDVEIDREMIEMIRDPITHIIRNAVDHGVEAPETRKQNGKRATGKIRITARQSGNQVLVEIEDDGQGIDTDKLGQKAVAANIVTSADLMAMSEKAKLSLIFAPGLSTANEVTAISGRGVGMDVVKANVERIGGTVEVESVRGKGSMMSLRVPLTLTIIPCLTLSAGGQRFALPRSSVREIVRVKNSHVKIASPGGARVAYIRGECMPFISLQQILCFADADEELDSKTIITVSATANIGYALCVDAVMDHEELVVRPGSPFIMANDIYAGTTLPDNGLPMLLLDPLGLSSKAQIGETEDDIYGADNDNVEVEENGGQALIFRDFSDRRHAMRLSVIDRVEDFSSAMLCEAGGVLRITLDGESVPVTGFDGAAPPEGMVKFLNISDGASRMLYAIKDFSDIVTLPAQVEVPATPGRIESIALIGDDPIEIIDTHWLFANQAKPRKASEARGGDARATCCVVGSDSRWCDAILAPLLRNAGYDLQISDDINTEADVILIDGTDHPDIPETLSPRIVYLSERDRQDNQGQRINRYDRLALLDAMEQARAAGGNA